MHQNQTLTQRISAFGLALVMLFSVLSTGITFAGAADSTGSTLSSVTESYVDASSGKSISRDMMYSVTHEEKSPQKIANYTYVDYSEYVERVYSHKDVNYIYGYPDRTVKPDQSMSRGEAAAVFCRLYDEVYPSMSYRMSSSTFQDLKTSAWYYKEVEILYNIGVIRDDKGDHKFRGEEPITRAEFATWAARWANLEYATGLSFSDVPVGHWAYGDINAASAAGWINGYPNGTFQPEASISRVEVMKLINGVVNRSVTLEQLTQMGIRNPYLDLATNHWGYADVIEATVQHSGADWHGTSYNNGNFNVIVEKFVDGEGNEIATSVTSSGKAEATTQQISGYEYIGYIRHITYVYNNGTAAPVITKAANVKESYVGGEIRYTVTITNKDTANAAWTNVVMTDELPQYLQMVDGSVYVNDKNTEYTLKDGVVSVPVGTIEAGASATIVFKCTVLPGAEGQTIKNTVVAKGDNGTVQDNIYTATDEGVYINQGVIKPSVEKKSNVSSASVGERVSYTITASNDASASYKIVDAVIADTIPEELTFRDGSVQVNGVSAPYSYDETAHKLSVSVGDIEPGKTATVTFAADVNNAAYSKTIYNVAVLGGNNIANVTDTDDGIIIADGKTRPTLVKAASKSVADVGDSITYTLTAGNTDDASVAIKNGVIKDTLPTGLEFKYGSVQVDGKSVSGTSYDEATRVLTIPVGDLAPGAAVKATFAASVTSAAYGKVVKNVAVLTGDNSPDTRAEDSGINVGDGTAKPYITKKANKTTATAGDRIEYTLTVGNDATATVPLTNPVITDVIPTGLDFVDGSVYVGGKSYSYYSYDDSTKLLTINLSDIARDSEVAVKFSAKVNTSAYNTTIENLATLTSDNGGTQQAKDTGVVIPDGRAQLEISKTADKRTPNVGDHVVYTIKVGNTAGAPVPARNVSLSDAIPAGLTFAGIVQVDGYSASYSYNSASGTLTIPVGDIAAGYTRTVTVEFIVDEDAYGKTITNTVVGSADNAGDKTATDAGLNVPDGTPDAYAAQKTVNKSNAKVGDTLTYTFRLSNGAGATAAWQNAKITDVLPDGLTFAGNVKMNGSTTTNYTYDADSRTIVLTAPSIAAGQVVTFNFDVTVNEGMQGQYVVNTAVVEGPGDQPDINISDPGTMIDPGAALPSVNKTANKSQAKVGETIVYTVTATNSSRATAAWKDVVLTDTLPEGVSLLNSVTSEGDPVTFSLNNGVLTARLGNIGIGETMTIRYEVLVLEEAAGTTLKNAVVLSGSNGSSSSQVSVPVDGSDDIPGRDPGDRVDQVYINKDVDKTVANLSGTTKDRQVTYTVKIGNISESKETWQDVILTDVIDTDLATFISDSVYVNGTLLSANQFVFANETLTIELGDIACGKEVEVKFTLEFKNDAGGKYYVNIAKATGTMGGSEVWDTGSAPTVQVLPKDVQPTQIHYAIFHGVGDSQGNPTGRWEPNKYITLDDLAIAAYRILTNDGQVALQNSATNYIPEDIVRRGNEVKYMVGAGVLNANEFRPTSGMVQGTDYTVEGSAEDPLYRVYATKSQIERVCQAVFGKSAGVSGSSKMTRLEVATLFCQIQGRDTNPNYSNAVSQGMTLDRFTDDNNNGIIIEVSNSHDYIKDSNGHETWVVSGK